MARPKPWKGDILHLRTEPVSTVTIHGVAIPRVELEIVRGQTRQKQRSVNVPAFLIGASRDCDLVLGDSQFAEIHAYLIVHAGGVSIRHLGFEPELIVNGEPVAGTTLKDGDLLCTGPYEFVIHVDHGAATDGGPRIVQQLPIRGWQARHAPADASGFATATQLIADIRLALKCPPRAQRPTRAAS